MTQGDVSAARLLTEVERFVSELDLLAGVDRLLVACSGGGDSIALLDILLELAPRFDVELVVVHLDHRFRGDESDADARFVAQVAAQRGVAHIAVQADPPPASGSLEEHFRDERLRLFRQAAGDTGADAVALGHTLDDQAETVIMNLARGSGRLGLGGIRARAQVRDLLLVRPLLQQRRERLRRYATERGLIWREDASNDDPRFVRNRVRAEVLPALEVAVPGAVANIARGAALLRQEELWLQSLAAVRLDEILVPGGGALTIPVARIEALPEPLSRRVIREALRRIRGNLRGVHLEHVDAVRDRVVTGQEGARDLPGVRASLRDGLLCFERLEKRRVVDGSGPSVGRGKS